MISGRRKITTRDDANVLHIDLVRALKTHDIELSISLVDRKVRVDLPEGAVEWFRLACHPRGLREHWHRDKDGVSTRYVFARIVQRVREEHPEQPLMPHEWSRLLGQLARAHGLKLQRDGGTVWIVADAHYAEFTKPLFAS